MLLLEDVRTRTEDLRTKFWWKIVYACLLAESSTNWATSFTGSIFQPFTQLQRRLMIHFVTKEMQATNADSFFITSSDLQLDFCALFSLFFWYFSPPIHFPKFIVLRTAGRVPWRALSCPTERRC